MPTPVDALRRLTEVLDRMRVTYAVGGSVAGSVHGVPRMTTDVDLVVSMKIGQIDGFVAELNSDFYADADMIRDHFRHGRSANIIHLGSGWKFDLFPLKDDAYSQIRMDRRTRREVRPDGKEAIECDVTAAEDVILRKLEWYRAGGEASERQWNDLRNIRNTATNKLDRTYMHKWAVELHVADLLEKLLTEPAQ